MAKLINISFRLPYRLAVNKSRLNITPSVGGLATALRSYLEASAKKDFDSLHWFGVSDVSKSSLEKAAVGNVIEKDGVVMHPVFLSPAEKETFYDGFCNSVLWPLFLYFPSFVVYREDYFVEYLAANELMCREVLEFYEPGDTIWVHDYHWMLLPNLIRERAPDARIGFFLHIPFPSFELIRLLPRAWREGILQGITGADVIGFQTADFVSHYVDALLAIAPSTVFQNGCIVLNNRTVMVREFPISIDFNKYNLMARNGLTRSSSSRIRERLGVQKIILSVDRLDYTKAIFNRLEGFELFLKQNNLWKEKVSYVLLMVPSRESILKYRENKQAIEALIARINGVYGTIGWTPVVYMYKSLDIRKLVALYAAADVALVIPARDGMNLVAKEYVTCRPDFDGVLLLSETAGAAEELREAVMVNPNDRQEIADSIVSALKMPPIEQRERIGKMQSQIKQHDVLRWATDFLNAVNNVSNTIDAGHVSGT